MVTPFDPMPPIRPAPATADPSAVVAGFALDHYLFGRIVAIGAADPRRSLTEALGLTRTALARLIGRHLPEHRPLLDALPAEAGPGTDAVEEPDYRAYLLQHRAGDAEEEEWLAAIVARRSQYPNHLWQDMGFASRNDLSAMFRRHFPELVRRNSGDMKWKKFIYRELCRIEGVVICKSPNCETCSDFGHCFGGEAGEPLQVLAQLAHPKPESR